MKAVIIAKTVLTEAGREIASSGREDQGQGSDAEVLAEIAGRECYDSWGAGRPSSEFHQHIIGVGHGSVHGHANWTWRISGISRNLSIELNRHHVGTGVSQRSTRYCDEHESPTILHPLTVQFLNDPDIFDEEASAREVLRKLIDETDRVSRQTYKLGVDVLQSYMMARGADRLGARKQARGAMARHLPNGLETSCVWTMNARAARNVVEQRYNAAADAEIRQLGALFYEGLKADSPQLFQDYTKVPSTDGLGDGVTTLYRKI